MTIKFWDFGFWVLQRTEVVDSGGWDFGDFLGPAINRVKAFFKLESGNVGAGVGAYVQTGGGGGVRMRWRRRGRKFNPSMWTPSWPNPVFENSGIERRRPQWRMFGRERRRKKT